MMANLRLVLGGDVQPGDEHTPKHGQADRVAAEIVGAEGGPRAILNLVE